VQTLRQQFHGQRGRHDVRVQLLQENVGDVLRGERVHRVRLQQTHDGQHQRQMRGVLSAPTFVIAVPVKQDVAFRIPKANLSPSPECTVVVVVVVLVLVVVYPIDDVPGAGGGGGVGKVILQFARPLGGNREPGRGTAARECCLEQLACGEMSLFPRQEAALRQQDERGLDVRGSVVVVMVVAVVE
jgi:hypothetical protein